MSLQHKTAHFVPFISSVMDSKAAKTSLRRPFFAVYSAFYCSSNVFVPSFQKSVDREAQKQLPRLLYLSTRDSLWVIVKDHVI